LIICEKFGLKIINLNIKIYIIKQFKKNAKNKLK